MRRNLVCLIALCVFLTCCNQKGPSTAQIEAALNEAVKAKNPDAEVKLYPIEYDNNPDYVEFKFSCTNCVFQFKNTNSPPIVVPSSEGHGMVTLSRKLQKWKFDRIIVVSKAVGQVSYESDHIF